MEAEIKPEIKKFSFAEALVAFIIVSICFFIRRY